MTGFRRTLGITRIILKSLIPKILSYTGVVEMKMRVRNRPKSGLRTVPPPGVLGSGSSAQALATQLRKPYDSLYPAS